VRNAATRWRRSHPTWGMSVKIPDNIDNIAIVELFNLSKVYRNAYFTLHSLDSNIKCNTQRPWGIGCCDGQTVQAPQRRGTWRDFGGASARGESSSDRLVAGTQRLDDRSGTASGPSGGRTPPSPTARSLAVRAVGLGGVSGAPQVLRAAAKACPRRLAACLCARQTDPQALVSRANCAQTEGQAPR
jgi:hypothetical protein